MNDVLSIKTSTEFKEEFKSAAKQAGMKQGEFLRAIYAKYAGNGSVVVGHVTEVDGASPGLLGEAIHKRLPDISPDEPKVEEAFATVNASREEIKLAHMRKRRGLNYNKNLEPLFHTLFEDGNERNGNRSFGSFG